ncbi:MAG: ATP-binding cassette domain-containing protein [Blautia sp.]|nr:ATP-binding cassette domain-containing protein [Blautia sp.]
MLRFLKGKAAGNFSGRFSEMMLRIGILAFWLVVWQICSERIGYGIFFASPLATFRKLLELLVRPSFWKALACTTGRILTGFCPAVVCGLLLAHLTVRRRFLDAFLMPVLQMMRTIPVASFIILALILVSSRYLTQLISFLMAMPLVCIQMQMALRQRDPFLEEMAGVFEVRGLKKWFYLTVPQLLAPFSAASKLALSFSWKSGIAAEVIGMPAGSIGERLQQAKVYLATADLFAWTCVILMASFATEKLWVFLLRLLEGRTRKLPAWEKRAGCKGKLRGKKDGDGTGARGMTGSSLAVREMTKGFEGREVFSSVSLSFAPGKIYALMGASGAGKTTLLRLIAELEQPDGGNLIWENHRKTAFQFQEERLLEHLSAMDNIHFACPGYSDGQVSEALEKLGIDSAQAKEPIAAFSGGMKRRVSLLRALLCPADLLLLDEPFKGLDEENVKKAAEYLRRMQNGRTVIMATHSIMEAQLCGAEIVRLTEAAPCGED